MVVLNRILMKTSIVTVAVVLAIASIVALYVDTNTHAARIATLQVDSKYHKSMTELCKSYRQWQQLPEINGRTTRMDPICTKYEPE